MNTQYRDLRKAEILQLSRNALHRRVRRQRAVRTAGGACAVLAVAALTFIAVRSRTKPAPEPIAHLSAPIPVQARVHAAPQQQNVPVAPVQVDNSAEPSWVLHTAPVRSDQIIRTSKNFVAEIATDDELMECLIEVGEPGVVRARGRVFSSIELAPREAEHNTGPESLLTPEKDSAWGRQIAAL